MLMLSVRLEVVAARYVRACVRVSVRVCVTCPVQFLVVILGGFSPSLCYPCGAIKNS